MHTLSNAQFLNFHFHLRGNKLHASYKWRTGVYNSQLQWIPYWPQWTYLSELLLFFRTEQPGSSNNFRSLQRTDHWRFSGGFTHLFSHVYNLKESFQKPTKGYKISVGLKYSYDQIIFYFIWFMFSKQISHQVLKCVSMMHNSKTGPVNNITIFNSL